MHTEIESLKIELEKLKTENALLKTDVRKYRLAIENSPATIVITNSNGEIEYANPAFERITGYSIAEVLGKTPRVLKSGRHNDIFYEQLWQCLKNGDSWEGEFYNRKKDGTYYWEEAFIGAIKDEMGTVSHFVAVKLDITYKKEAEASINQINALLQENNAAKDKLFSIIAHDLKNPFWAILSFSKLISESISTHSFEDLQKMSTMMNQSAQHIYNLIENLMQWARSQSGRIEFNPQQYDLFAMVYETILTQTAQSEYKHITLMNFVEPATIIFGDNNLLSTVIRNLISNSIKFTNPGGQISISYQDLSGNSQITVTDTGVGISAEGIDRLFKIENKYSTRGTIEEAGTGLGLVICKEFIEKHGGRIWAESEVGVGSKFIFTIPKSA